jgi:type VI secretion system protein ImpA
MAEPQELDLDLLVSPIPGSDPAGAPLPDDVRRKLDELRREPDAFDLSAGAPDKKADWYGVASLAEQVLTSQSKDLLVAIRLTEALAKQSGFAGLTQGFTLLTRLVNEAWDRLHPKPEGEDYGARIGPFLWMNHATKGAKLPVTIANIPLFRRDDVDYGFVYVSENAKDTQRAEFERVFESLKMSELQEFKKVADSVRASYAACMDLGAALDQRFGENAPDLLSQENPDNIGRTLHGVVDCIDRLLKKSGLEGGTEMTEEAAGTDASTGAAAGGSIDAKRASREALYRQVGQIADALAHLEPHSPIPFLLKRIVRLGALPFPDLMRELVRESSTIEEFDRLLGIKKEEGT